MGKARATSKKKSKFPKMSKPVDEAKCPVSFKSISEKSRSFFARHTYVRRFTKLAFGAAILDTLVMSD